MVDEVGELGDKLPEGKLQESGGCVECEDVHPPPRKDALAALI